MGKLPEPMAIEIKFTTADGILQLEHGVEAEAG